MLTRQLLLASHVGLTSSLDGSCIVPRMIYWLNALPVEGGNAAIDFRSRALFKSFRTSQGSNNKRHGSAIELHVPRTCEGRL